MIQQEKSEVSRDRDKGSVAIVIPIMCYLEAIARNNLQQVSIGILDEDYLLEVC